MYKAFPYEKTSVRTKLYKCFYVFISYRERISFISDAAPRRLTSKCACGRVLFKSQLLTLGYFCFGYRPVGSYIFFGNRSQSRQNLRITIVIRRFCFSPSVCTRYTSADCSLFHKYCFKTQVWAERILFLNLRILLF